MTTFAAIQSNPNQTKPNQTKPRIQHSAEESIFSLPEYKNWCLLANSTLTTTKTNECMPIVSVLSPGLPGSFFSAEGLLLDYDERERVIDQHWCENGSRKAIALKHANDDFDCMTPRGLRQLTITKLKSELLLGGPLYKNHPEIGPQYATISDDPLMQTRLGGNNFVLPDLAPHVKHLTKIVAENSLRLTFGGLSWLGVSNYGVVLSYIVEDMMFAVGAMVIVFAYLLFNLESLFLAAGGFFQIVISVPLSFACFMMMGFTHVSFLQFMGLFIILGIGADDIFVFMDAYRQCQRMTFADDLSRFSYAYKRAAGAMLTTSLTTGIAFFATAISPIPAIAAFGITMGFMVMINFLLAVTFFPACVVYFYRHLDCNGACCFSGAALCSSSLHTDAKPTEKGVTVSPTNFDRHINHVLDQMGECTIDVMDLGEDVKSEEGGIVEKNENEGDDYPYRNEGFNLDEFFRTKFAGIIAHRIFRRMIILFTIVILALSVSIASSLRITGNLPVYFDDNHPYNVFRSAATSPNFAAGSAVPKIQLNVFFGVNKNNPVTRLDVDPQSSYDGTANFDANFDINDFHAFSSILNFCRTVSKDSDLVADGEVYCFAEDFVDFLNTTHSLAFNEANFDLYHDSDEFQLFQKKRLTERFAVSQPFTGVSDWSLTSEFDGTVSRGDISILEATTMESIQRFAFITFNTTMPLTQSDLSLGESRVIFDKWQRHIDNHNSYNPNANALQNCNYWYFLIGGEEVVATTLQGIVATLICVYMVLIIGNGSFVVANLAILTIISIMVVIAAVVCMMDWTIDYLTSICLIVSIGLSVDFVVHISHSYQHSKAKTSECKARDAISEMGTSIISGSITTTGAATFLLLTDFLFFSKFGFFLAITMVTSVYFALAVFTSILAEWGPTDNAVVTISDDYDDTDYWTGRYDQNHDDHLEDYNYYVPRDTHNRQGSESLDTKSDTSDGSSLFSDVLGGDVEASGVTG